MEHTIKAVFSDVDGTLLNASHRVTPKTGEWIHKILKSGIHFVIVSARSPSGIYPIMRRNDLHCALIAYSGALIMDEERNVLYSRQIDRQTALRIEAFIREQGYDLSICIYSGDDWLAPGAAEEMLETLNRNPGVDAVVFDLMYVDGEGNELRCMQGTEHESEFSFASDPAFLFSPHNAVNKLWKRELFLASGIRFPDRMWFEDLATVPKLCLRLERILPVPQAWYCYYQRPGSIMSAAQASRNLDMLTVAETVEQYYRGEGAFERCLPELTYKFWYEELLASVTRVNRIDPKSEIQGQLRDDFLRRFPEYKKCSYVRHAPLRLRLLADAICRGDWRGVKLMTDLNNKRKGR